VREGIMAAAKPAGGGGGRHRPSVRNPRTGAWFRGARRSVRFRMFRETYLHPPREGSFLLEDEEAL